MTELAGTEVQAAEIMNLLFEGKKVTVGLGNMEEGKVLINHLRVLKSRAIKRFTALGMDLDNERTVLKTLLTRDDRGSLLHLVIEPLDAPKYRIIKVEDSI